MRLSPSLSLLLLLSAPAAHADAVSTGGALTAAPAEWLGATPHLVIMGTVDGHALDIQYPDIAAAGVAEFAGKREYLPGEAGAFRYGDFEVALKAVIGDVERAIELEFENHDFTDHPLPATFALQDKEFPEGLFSTLEAELEWESAAGTVNAEAAGWTGTLVLAEDSGSKDDKGLVPDGMIGGLVTATKGGDTLVVSFTVPVAEYEIDD